MSLKGYQEQKHGVRRDQIEWFGSPLHHAFLRAVESKAILDVKDKPKAPPASSLEEAHADLREFIAKWRPRASVKEYAGESARCRELLRHLWEELEVPEADRYPKKLEMDDEHDLMALVDHARTLLTYRDKTVCVIHGLVQHDAVAARLRESQVSQGSSELWIAQLTAVDKFLVEAVVEWSKRIVSTGGPKYNMGTAMALAARSPRPAFLWRGMDALERLHHEVYREGGNGWPLPDTLPALHLGALHMPEDPQEVHNGTRGQTAPQNCAGRAARDSARGLRALLRSAGDSRKGHSSTQISKLVAACGRSPRGSYAKHPHQKAQRDSASAALTSETRRSSTE